MRIAIDARFLTHPQRGGFKTYVQGLVEGLGALSSPHEFIAYVDRPMAEPATPSGIDVRVIPGSAPVIGMPWREQALLAWALRRDGIDVFHAPCHTAPLLSRVPLVLTVHDMLWEGTRRWRRQVARAALERYYHMVTARAVRRARALLTVSEFSKRAICESLPWLDPSTVVVAHNAPRACFVPVTDQRRLAEARASAGVDGDFVLALASADPRKNLPALLEAYALLPLPMRRQHPLVTVWAHDALAADARRRCATLGIETDVRFVSAVDDPKLAALFSAATIFAFPSLAEGFGLPVLEAMACGAPVVAGLHPAIGEVAGEAGCLVDTADARVLSEAVGRLLTDPARRNDLRHQGLERTKMFSWELAARRAIGAYETAHAAQFRGSRHNKRYSS